MKIRSHSASTCIGYTSEKNYTDWKIEGFYPEGIPGKGTTELFHTLVVSKIRPKTCRIGY